MSRKAPDKQKKDLKNLSQLGGKPKVIGVLVGSSNILQIGILIVAVFSAYFLSLDVPFYLDDYSSIRENFAIRDLSNLKAVIDFSPMRAFSYISFAINYALHGYNVFGYHVVNIVIHLSAAIVTFAIAKQLLELSSPDFPEKNLTSLFPITAALLFALHPLQTQAVTYIVQRSASMAGLFYLVTLFFYIKARRETKSKMAASYFAAAIISSLIAIFTKQNAVTLPLALLLVEIVYFDLRGWKLIKLLIAMTLVTVSGGVLLYVIGGNSFFSSLSEAARETDLVSRLDYLAIQVGVIWSYILKYFVPLTLQLEYDIGIASFSDFNVQFMALLHIVSIGVGLVLLRNRPIIGFSILFYYVAHLVESSIIPIRDFAFEHRTYLPNFGLSLLVAYCLLVYLPKFLSHGKVLLTGTAVLVVLFSLTIARNNTWRDPVAFYIHETEVNPQLLRPWSMLGETYLRLEENELAVEVYEKGEQFYGRGFDRQNNTQVAFYQNYVLALDRIGLYDDALEVLSRINLDALDPGNRAVFLQLRGNVYGNLERFAEAHVDLSEAIQLDPSNIDAWLSLGKAEYILGDLFSARESFEQVIERDPQHYHVPEAELMLKYIEEYFSQFEQN